jgi:hypothetical protein
MFFSHNKSVSVGLSAIETISRIVTKKRLRKNQPVNSGGLPV